MSPMPDSTLDDGKRVIAELRHELTQLTAERDEAIAARDEAQARETATAEVLQVLNASTGDPRLVFDAMLDKATRLCDASFGILWNFDGEFATAAALHQVPAAYVELCRVPFRPSSGSGPAQMMRGEGTLAIADLTDYPPYLAGDELTRAILDLAGARSVVIAPVRKDETSLGAITLYRREVRPFTDKQIALLQNFAAQAAIAMENASLRGELRARTDELARLIEELEVLGEVGRVVSLTIDLGVILSTVLERSVVLTDSDAGVIFRYHQSEGTFEYIRSVGWDWPMVREVRDMRVAETATALGEALTDRRPLQIPDLRLRASNPLRDVALGVDLRSALIVPLIGSDDILGVIVLQRRATGEFSETAVRLVQTLATQSVIAIQNARLLGELRQRTEEVTELNRGLEARVAEQVEELARVGRLKRFLAPQLAELIVSQGEEKILESHRREIVVVFCDLRGYTAFTETAEPEEVLDFLREYHGALGPLVSQFEGTLDQFSGDGIMVFFNDPVPIPDPAERAVRMAVAMREAAGTLITAWRRRDRELGFGVGVAQGYATLGQIGFAERSGYTAIGTVCNLAARLCAQAKDGQILISGRVAAAVETAVPLEDLGSLALKGLSQPVSAFNVPLTATQPALRVIEGGPRNV